MTQDSGCAPDKTSGLSVAAGRLRRAMELHRAGSLDEAEAMYRAILAADAKRADAWHLLGVIAHQRRRYAEAVELIGRAIALNAANAAYHANLALALRDLGRLDEAVASGRRAVQINPRHAEAHNSLGVAYQEQGSLVAAIESFRRALACRPEFPEAAYNLGNALRLAGDLDEAVACYRRALALRPTYVDACNNLSIVLKRQGRLDEAVAILRRAIELDPGSSDLFMSLGAALKAQQRFDEAAECYRRALAIRPDNPAAELLLLNLQREMCEWQGHEGAAARTRQASARRVPAYAGIPPMTPFAFLGVPGSTAAEQRRCAEAWCRSKFPALAAKRPILGSSAATDRIRLGYLSADFRNHNSSYLLAEVIELHDRSRFQVFAYSIGADDGGGMRRRLVRAFERFVDLTLLSDAEAARRIEADGVDILIDLNGHTEHARTEILGLRPAPVQVNYLGYPGTTGAWFIDYLIADPFVVPPEAAPHYSEAIAYLPHCYQPNDRRRPVGARPSRADCGLPAGGIVFCCLHQPDKITPEVFGIWCRLLEAVPASVLWLYESNRWAPDNLRHEAAVRSIDPCRLVFAPYKPRAEHLGRLELADIWLDTLPYNAHTSASDALWSGVPLVTRAGETFASRVAGSLLRAIGLPELITYTAGDYYELCLKLARDPGEIGRLKARLAANKLTTPLFDTPRYVRNLEALYVEMHRRHWAREAPSMIALDRLAASARETM